MNAFIHWQSDVCASITAAFHEQVSSLFETVKMMDNALQRRAKISTTNSSFAGAEPLRDSDKIALQVQLDVKAYGEDLYKLGMWSRDHLTDAAITASVEAYDKLLKETEEMAKQQLQQQSK